MTAEDGNDGGGFLRDMAAQSARAQEFDRRLRWSRLSKALRTDGGVAGHAAEAASDEEVASDDLVAPDDLVDLRDRPEPVSAAPATTSGAPAVPRPRPRE